MTQPDWRLGIDLGTSSVKLAVLDAEGRLQGGSQASFATISDCPGQAEQEPQAWLTALAAAVEPLRARLGQDSWRRVGAIGLAGQIPTLVCLGPDGAWPRAIAWLDARADGWAISRLEPGARQAWYQRTGMPISGRYLAPLLRYHHGRAPAGLIAILSAKDWLCWWLTGIAVTDPSTAAGYGVFDLADGGWAADLCTIWDLDPGLLPAIAPAIAQAGGLQPHAASLLGLPVGTPVHVGAADSVAGAFALGGTCPAAVCVMMGSSTVIIARAESPSPDFSARFLLTPHALPGQWGIEMDLLATGTGYGWLTGLLRPEAGDLDALAALSVPGARGLVFAPYLAGGEQGALWDPLLTGVLHGLTLAHGAADIARAFLEGVQFEIRRCLDVLAEFGPLSQVFVSGGVTRHPGTLQMLADITGRAVTPSDDPSPAARGAALLAGASHASLLDAKLPIFPSPGATEYAPLYRRYLDLCPRVARPPSG